MADYERSQTVEAPAGALFEFLADVGNLPRYFEQMTAAEPAGGEAVRVTAVVDGREREGEAWFRVDREAKRVEDRPEEINQGLDRTLGNVKRLVEEPGAADT
jgi:ribosome-associated toxin RatA of RatAB toxin-antitoxin module